MADHESEQPEIRAQNPEANEEEVGTAVAESERLEDSKADLDEGVKLAEQTPFENDEEFVFVSDAEARVRGRKRTLESGWEPLASKEVLEQQQKNQPKRIVIVHEEGRPPFVEEQLESQPAPRRERPPLVEEVSMKRERPPFVE